MLAYALHSLSPSLSSLVSCPRPLFRASKCTHTHTDRWNPPACCKCHVSVAQRALLDHEIVIVIVFIVIMWCDVKRALHNHKVCMESVGLGIKRKREKVLEEEWGRAGRNLSCAHTLRYYQLFSIYHTRCLSQFFVGNWIGGTQWVVSWLVSHVIATEVELHLLYKCL